MEKSENKKINVIINPSKIVDNTVNLEEIAKKADLKLPPQKEQKVTEIKRESLLEREIQENQAIPEQSSSDPNVFTSTILHSDAPQVQSQEPIVREIEHEPKRNDNPQFSESLRYSTQTPSSQNQVAYRTVEDETTRINPTLSHSHSRQDRVDFGSDELRSLRGETADASYEVFEAKAEKPRNRLPWETES